MASKKAPLSFYLTFGTPAAISFALGCWQTKRYFWKKNLIEERKANLYREDHREFDPSVKENLDEAIKRYEPLQFEGEFLNDLTQLLGPRKSPEARRSGIQMSDNGYYVLTPLKTKDGIVLVNRGWIHEKERSKIDAPEGKVSIVGVMREAEYPSYIHPDKFYYKGIWFINDPAKIFERLGIRDTPILVDLTVCDYDTTLETKHPEDFVVFTTMPATHFSYLVTWFSLCAWCIFGAYAFRSKQMRQLLNAKRRKSQSGVDEATFTSTGQASDGRVNSERVRTILSMSQENASQRKQHMQSLLNRMQQSSDGSGREQKSSDHSTTTTPDSTNEARESRKPNEQP